MSCNFHTVLDHVETVKEKLTDQEYRNIVEALGQLHARSIYRIHFVYTYSVTDFEDGHTTMHLGTIKDALIEAYDENALMLDILTQGKSDPLIAPLSEFKSIREMLTNSETLEESMVEYGVDIVIVSAVKWS